MTIYSFIALISYMSGMLHAFHISVCEIELDENTHSLEISQRIFLDDLEESLTLWSGQTGIDVINPKSKEELDAMIGLYVTERFNLTINGRQQDLQYLGAKVKGDVMMVFLKVKPVKKIKSISIENTVLMELFADQINLIHMTVNDNLQSLKLNLSEPSSRLDW